MHTQLKHMIALEQSRELDRKVAKHRAAPIATPATSRNPAFAGVVRTGGWWQLHRRLRHA